MRDGTGTGLHEMKVSNELLVSERTRLLAEDSKVMKLPSALIEGRPLFPPVAWAPPEATLMRSVVPVSRSLTKTSVAPLVSPATRLAASDEKATRCPSALMELAKLK